MSVEPTRLAVLPAAFVSPRRQSGPRRPVKPWLAESAWLRVGAAAVLCASLWALVWWAMAGTQA